jgi:hypothetical protein
VPYTPPNQDPGQWQPTPPDFSPATTAHIPHITPFAVPNTSVFGPPPPPALTSQEYADNFNEVKALGSLTSTVRTPDQTQVAFLWRLPLTNFQVWDRIAQDMATRQGTTLEQTARLFALLDITENDGLETSYTAKYQYALWRPITAIRDPRSDLINPETQSDPTWTTLHPTTPAFPTYPSNAGAEGGTSATILAAFFGTDDIPFQVHWDAYGFLGVTRSYDGFWAAASEEGRSRVYGGIHFTFDVTAGQEIGRRVGDFIFDHFLLPASESARGSDSGSEARTDEGNSRGLTDNPGVAGADLVSHLLGSRSAPPTVSPTSVLPTPPADSPTMRRFASSSFEASTPAPDPPAGAVDALGNSNPLPDVLGGNELRLGF